MDWSIYLLLFIIGYIIYKGLSSSEDKPEVQQDQYQRRRTGRGSSGSTQQQEKDSLIQSAQRQERINNYDEASRLYLRAGQVFSAAKMKAMAGPNRVNEALDLIRVNAPGRAELITRNLANEFFYRLEQPATSAALLRGLGLHDEAEAVEVAAGITVPQTRTEPISTQSASVQETPIQEPEPVIIADVVPDISPPIEQPSDEGEKAPPAPKDTYPNSMMMASSTISDHCSVCRREIKSGDSFIYCLSCGKPGHYGHLGEMIKVTGKCPICKNRLTPTMYDI